MPAKLTTDQFIEKAISIHGNLYNYEKTKYTTNKAKVTILCATHGDFEQTASHHLLGSKCPKCARISVANNLAIKNAHTKDFFIRNANKKHNNFYTYLNTIYINSKTKVTITCPIHGNFDQTPNDHLDGCGCPKCKYATQKTFWSYTDWKLAGESSKNFKEFTLYAILCTNETESFIKIGKTFLDITTRFQKGVKMPYNWEVLFTYTNTAETISKLEKTLHNLYRQDAYVPNIKFGGSYECFNYSILTNLISLKEASFERPIKS